MTFSHFLRECLKGELALIAVLTADTKQAERRPPSPHAKMIWQWGKEGLARSELRSFSVQDRLQGCSLSIQAGIENVIWELKIVLQNCLYFSDISEMFAFQISDFQGLHRILISLETSIIVFSCCSKPHEFIIFQFVDHARLCSVVILSKA